MIPDSYRIHESAPTPAGPARRSRWLAIVLLLVVVVPFGVTIVRTAVWDQDAPTGDYAALDLDVHAGRHAFPETGSYSQYGFRHPGPMFIGWMIAARLVVGGTSAYEAGVVALHAAFVLLAAVMVWRRWGSGAATVTVIGLTGLLIGVGWMAMISPWNPAVAVLGAPALVLVGACAWDGDRTASIAAVVLGSMLTQAHVGNAAMTAAVLLAIVVGQLRSGIGVRRLLGNAISSGVIGLVLWLPPLIEQLRNGKDGNLSLLLRFSREGSFPTTGMHDAFLAAVRAFRPRPMWLGGVDAPDGAADHGVPVWFLAVILMGIVAVVVARRRRRRRQTPDMQAEPIPGIVDDQENRPLVSDDHERAIRLVVLIGLLAIAAATLMLGLGRGPVRPYYAYHLQSLAGLVTVAAVVDLVRRIVWRAPVTGWAVERAGRTSITRGQATMAVVLVATTVLSLVDARGVVPPPGLPPSSRTIAAAVAEQRLEHAPEGRIVVSAATAPGVPPEFAYSIGFVALLEQDGLPVAAGPGLSVAAPPSLRVAAAGPHDLDVVVFAGDPAAAPADWPRLGELAPGLTVMTRPTSRS